MESDAIDEDAATALELADMMSKATIHDGDDSKGMSTPMSSSYNDNTAEITLHTGTSAAMQRSKTLMTAGDDTVRQQLMNVLMHQQTGTQAEGLSANEETTRAGTAQQEKVIDEQKTLIDLLKKRLLEKDTALETAHAKHMDLQGTMFKLSASYDILHAEHEKSTTASTYMSLMAVVYRSV